MSNCGSDKVVPDPSRRSLRDARNIAHGFVWYGPQLESIEVPGALSTRAFAIYARGTRRG